MCGLFVGFYFLVIFLREMLTNTLRALVNNPFEENFYVERKKKQLMF